MTDASGRLRLVDPSTGKEFDFGTVTDISETFQKSVSVTPIVTKTKQDAFPIETRTYKQITVSFTRRNPLNANDSSSDVSRWSNGAWTKALMASLDRWQARTDGYRLYFQPASDNPHVAPIAGPSGSTYETGYVRNLDLKHVKGRPEVIQGTFEFHVGTMRVKTSSSSDGFDREGFFIALSDTNKSNDIILLQLKSGQEINLVESCEITGGPEAPFEYAQVRIKRKALSAMYPGYADSASISERVKAGLNRLTISLAGTSTMTVTKVKLTNTTLTLTAYCEAERIKGYILSDDAHGLPGWWMDQILTSGRYGVVFSSSDIVRSYQVPSGEVRFKAAEDLRLKFSAGTNVWYILQVAAMVCGARVFFAKNKAYIVDYRRSTSSVSPASVDLYGGGDYTGAVVGNVDLGDEGMDTVANTIRIRCSSPKVDGDGRYEVADTGDTAYESIEYTVKDDGSISIYGGERDGGLFSLDTLRQNANPDELVYNGSPAKKDEGGSDTPTEGESGSEGQEGGTTTVEDGVAEFYEQAERFGSNYLDYVCEAQQTVKFTLRELAGSGAGSWCPFFEPAAMASKIIDDVDDIYVDNVSDKGSGARYQKLALKTFTRTYPECTSEYTWGVLASMDLSSNTSRIMSAQNTK